MWSSIQVLPNQVSEKSFYTFEDIDLRESHAKLHEKPSETLGAEEIKGKKSVSTVFLGTLGKCHFLPGGGLPKFGGSGTFS